MSRRSTAAPALGSGTTSDYGRLLLADVVAGTARDPAAIRDPSSVAEHGPSARIAHPGPDPSDLASLPHNLA
jgi:hypothetical protein